MNLPMGGAHAVAVRHNGATAVLFRFRNRPSRLAGGAHGIPRGEAASKHSTKEGNLPVPQEPQTPRLIAPMCDGLRMTRMHVSPSPQGPPAVSAGVSRAAGL
jgi:hypothetical protein